jgi:hypothetical protein
LIDAFNRRLSQAIEAGFVNHYSKNDLDLNYLKKKVDNTRKPLNMQHLFGVFNLWLIGCAIALIIFVVEVFAVNFKQVFRIK